MPINDTTSSRAYQKPNIANALSDDVTRLRSALDSIDTDVATALGAGFPSGTVMLFAQTAAPTGWTKSTTHNDKALRVVSGTASSGGTTAFTSVFASRTPAGTVGATTLTTSQIPAHSHVQQRATLGAATGQFSQSSTFSTTPTPLGYSTQDTGSGSSHTHTFTGTAMDFAVQYVDVILASKD